MYHGRIVDAGQGGKTEIIKKVCNAVSRGDDQGMGGDIRNLRVILTVIVAGVLMVLDAVTPLGLAVWFLQVVLVWIASLWANRQQMIAVAAVCSSLIVLGFVLGPKSGLAISIEISNLLLSLGAVGAISHACLRQRAMEEAGRKTEEKLAQSRAKVRILSGLLPICASCKNIRNEAGAWQQLETYIANHSEAAFTHGICQECAARLYPDLFPLQPVT